MPLARVHTITRYIGVCSEHPHWVAPSYSDRESVERLVKAHNDAEHQGTEALDD